MLSVKCYYGALSKWTCHRQISMEQKVEPHSQGMKILSHQAFFHYPCSFINLFIRLISLSLWSVNFIPFFSLSVKHLTSNCSSVSSSFFPLFFHVGISPYSDFILQAKIGDELTSDSSLYVFLSSFQKIMWDQYLIFGKSIGDKSDLTGVMTRGSTKSHQNCKCIGEIIQGE